MNIYIVRHGETVANKGGAMQGGTDTALTEYGRELARLTGLGLKDVRFDAAISSPLKRAMDTCKIILANSGNDNLEIQTDERIKEINLGVWEGKSFKGENPEIPREKIEKFFKNPFLIDEIEGGETAREVCKRGLDFLKSLKGREYQNVLVTTHAFLLRAMLNFMYENKDDFWQGRVPLNCCCNIIRLDGDTFSFVERDKIYYDNSIVVDRYKLK